MEEEIEPFIFIKGVSLGFENSSKSGWSDELNIQCSPPVFSPLCDNPLEKYLSAEEMDAEVDHLYSLLEKQDNAYETKSWSLTFEKPDSAEG